MPGTAPSFPDLCALLVQDIGRAQQYPISKYRNIHASIYVTWLRKFELFILIALHHREIEPRGELVTIFEKWKLSCSCVRLAEGNKIY